MANAAKNLRDAVEAYRGDSEFPYGEGSAPDRQFEHCCGMFEIGGFGEPDEVLETLQTAYDSDLFYDENEEREVHNLPEPSPSLVVALVRDYIETLMESNRACVATTVASQTHAIEALRSLGFKPMKVTRRVTLWIKKARGIRS